VTANSSARRTYTPLLALPWWDKIGPFLTALVDDVSTDLGVEPRSLYPFLTPFVLWCWQTKALDLDRQKMFRRSRIESFGINGMPGLSRGTKNTVRGKLRSRRHRGTDDGAAWHRKVNTDPALRRQAAGGAVLLGQDPRDRYGSARRERFARLRIRCGPSDA